MKDVSNLILQFWIFRQQFGIHVNLYFTKQVIPQLCLAEYYVFRLTVLSEDPIIHKLWVSL